MVVNKCQATCTSKPKCNSVLRLENCVPFSSAVMPRVHFGCVKVENCHQRNGLHCAVHCIRCITLHRIHISSHIHICHEMYLRSIIHFMYLTIGFCDWRSYAQIHNLIYAQQCQWNVLVDFYYLWTVKP